MKKNKKINLEEIIELLEEDDDEDLEYFDEPDEDIPYESAMEP